jgi:hypothetical protein
MLHRSVGQAMLAVCGVVALAVVFVSAGAAEPAPQAASGSVTVEWFGWSHYRFTSKSS